MRYCVQAQIEHRSTDERHDWSTSIGVPTFYVDAIDEDNARTIALGVLRPRPNETPHLSVMAAEVVQD